MNAHTVCLDLALPAVSASVPRAREAVGRAVASAGGDDRLADDVRLCVSEAVSNVVRHAYADGKRSDVGLVVERDDGELIVVVRDSGRGMSPSPTKGAGGYGLKIIDEITNSHTLSSSRSGTEVRMVFRVDQSAPSGE
jgi:anti-sigma regulatory factor (Ser/Thr protein kinase)